MKKCSPGRVNVALIIPVLLASLSGHSAENITTSTPAVQYEVGSLPSKWITGGPECTTFHDDFQVHKYNEDFYILRESGCVHTEKPFLYLLFGADKAILFDTGAGNDTDATTGKTPDVVGAVNGIINQWLKQNNRKSIHLVVAHLHSHSDHI